MKFRKCTKCNKRTEYLFRCERCKQLFCPSDICAGSKAVETLERLCAFCCVSCRIQQFGGPNTAYKQGTESHWKYYTVEYLMVHPEVFGGY